MVERFASYALQYGVYLLEAVVLCFLLLRARSRRLAGLTLYVALLLGLDGGVRRYVLSAYGVESTKYFATFWLTDVLLELGAFSLVCLFFQRACAREEKMWHFVRLLLVFVFILVAGISVISLSTNPDQFFSRFIIEFQQNLYFTCLVLNTLLYLLMVQIESADEELGLLVCGLGIQFAGPAAGFALLHLTPDQPYSRLFAQLIDPLCTVGMLLTWMYAVARRPKSVTVPGRNQGTAPDTGEVAVSRA